MRRKVVDLRLGDDVLPRPLLSSLSLSYFICTYVRDCCVCVCLSVFVWVCKLYLPFTFYSTKYFVLFVVDLNNLLASECIYTSMCVCVLALCVWVCVLVIVICTKHFWHIICFIWRIVCLFCWFAAPSSASFSAPSSSSSNHLANKQFGLNLCKFISLTFGLFGKTKAKLNFSAEEFTKWFPSNHSSIA